MPAVLEGMQRNDSASAFSAYLILCSQLCTKTALSQAVIMQAKECICDNRPCEIAIPAIGRLMESQPAARMDEKSSSFCLQVPGKVLHFLREKAAPAFERELVRALSVDTSKEENSAFLTRLNLSRCCSHLCYS